MLRLPRRELQVDKVSLARYEGVRPSAVDLFGSRGYLVGLHGRFRNEPVTTWGEWIIPDDDGDQHWEKLRKIAATLPGTSIPLKKWTADRQSRLPWSDDEDGPANLAVESAIFNAQWDTNMRHNPLANTHRLRSRLLCNRLRIPRTKQALRSKMQRDKVTEQISESTATVLKISGTGDVEMDRMRLRFALRAAAAAARGLTIWLLPRGPYAENDAHRLVEKTATLINKLEDGPKAVISHPLPTGRLDHLQRLQEAADAHSGPTGQKVFVAAQASSEAEVAEFRRLAPSVSLEFDPSKWGSLAAMAPASRHFKRGSDMPGKIWLTSSRFNNGRIAAAENLLMSAAPGIDFCLQPEPRDNWPTLRTEDDPEEVVNMSLLAPLVDNVAFFPPPEQPTPLKPNDFSDEPLTNFPASMLMEARRERAALQLGFSTQRFRESTLIVTHPDEDESFAYRGYDASEHSLPVTAIAGDKYTTHQLGQRHGFPVPEAYAFASGDLKAIEVKAEELGYPVVVKPRTGSRGLAITTNIATPEGLRSGVETIENSEFGEHGVLLERHIAGSDYRILATGEKSLSIVRRDPAHVIGDGSSTITELVLAANATRSVNPNMRANPIRLGQPLIDHLATQDLTVDSVPALEERVQLVGVANISQGGTSTEVTDETDQSILDLAQKICAELNFPLLGLDFLIPDHRQPVDDQDIVLLEINSAPNLLHPYPTYGSGRDIFLADLRNFIRSRGLQQPEVRDNVTLAMEIEGTVQRVGYREWMRRTAEVLGVTGWVSNCPDPNKVEAVVSGPATEVAWLTRLAIDGSPKAFPNEVTTRPHNQPVDTGFEIRTEM